MSVIAFFYSVLFENTEYIITSLVSENRRIVQKYYRFKTCFQGFVQRGSESAYFSVEYFFIAVRFGIIKPTSCSAHGIAVGCVCGIEYYFYGIEAVFFKVHLHFAACIPPVIVIALKKKLLARKSVYKSEVLKGIGKLHRPRNITGNDYCIIMGYKLSPVFLKPFLVAVPASEYVHRLVGSKR